MYLCLTNQITLNNKQYILFGFDSKLKNTLADSVEDAAAVVPGEAAVHRRRGRRRRPARGRPLLRSRRRRLSLDPELIGAILDTDPHLADASKIQIRCICLHLPEPFALLHT